MGNSGPWVRAQWDDKEIEPQRKGISTLPKCQDYEREAKTEELLQTGHAGEITQYSWTLDRILDPERGHCRKTGGIQVEPLGPGIVLM